MSRMVAVSLIMMAAASMAFAGRLLAPEIDASAGGGALALITGGLLVLRARRKK
jgi:hypothetical protein